LIIPERAGVIRYFFIDDDKTVWADTPDELLKYYSQKELDYGARPRSFTFIPANIYDNEILLSKDVNYISSLKSQNKIDRERLLGCNWNISLSDYGVVLSRHDFNRYTLADKLNIQGYFIESYFVLDGASRTSEANDYSVLGFWAKGRNDKQYYIIDWLRVRLQEPDLEQAIIDKWNYWKSQKAGQNFIFNPKGVNIERGACGIAMMQRLPRKGIPCFELEPDKDKFHRLNDGLGIIKSKWVNVPDNAGWVEPFFEECESFRADMKHVIMDGEIKPHDDQVDNMAYAISSQVCRKVAIEVYNPVKTPQQRRNFIYD
jgi:predicted phage terminase large subunit-like protein